MLVGISYQITIRKNHKLQKHKIKYDDVRCYGQQQQHSREANGENLKLNANSQICQIHKLFSLCKSSSFQSKQGEGLASFQ